MSKDELIKYINCYILNIKISPELFHDGIDKELLDLLIECKKYIKEET